MRILQRLCILLPLVLLLAACSLSSPLTPVAATVTSVPLLAAPTSVPPPEVSASSGFQFERIVFSDTISATATSFADIPGNLVFRNQEPLSPRDFESLFELLLQ